MNIKYIEHTETVITSTGKMDRTPTKLEFFNAICMACLLMKSK